jgi:YfiH family protein
MASDTPFGQLAGIVHTFTGRDGGGSEAPFDTFNLAFHVGDDDAAVLRNHERLAARLGYERRKLVHMRQVHSARVVRCDAATDFTSRPECDALITDLPGRPLMVMAADCIPLLLYDPRRPAVAAVHAGRAGALKNIVAATLDAMRDAYGTDPRHLHAALGPSIRGCCYEVNGTIADEVRTAGYAEALSYRHGRPFLDVAAIVLRQLSEAGVPAEQVTTSPDCTACAHDRLFSYRADGGTTGRQAGVVMLRP